MSRVSKVPFDVPAVDLHENLVLGFWPSMAQSSAITKDAFYLVHSGIRSIPYPEAMSSGIVNLVDYTLIVVADYYLFVLPPGGAWMHEEWHRAVMSRRGISSYNDVYNFPIGESLINVSHVKDEDLIRLKREHPSEQVRMSSAGIEADLQRSFEFDKDRFFFQTRGATLFTQWLGTLNAIGYMYIAAHGSNKATEEHNEEEGANVEIRDFTGLDPDGWVYDLFRPDEPYEARGVHPSGVGIDRYRSASDMTARELRYLRAQAGLSFLNLLNPNLFGLYDFEVGKFKGEPLFVNASVGHVMAPFGYSMNLNLFARAGHRRLLGELRAYVNEALLLPGVSAELVRYPLPWRGASVTPRLRLWAQPKSQLFFANSAAPGGLLEARLNLPLVSKFEFYVEGSAKTAGWVPGNVFLDPALNLRTGFDAVFF